LRTDKLPDGCEVRTDIHTLIGANDFDFNDCDDLVEAKIIAEFFPRALLDHVLMRQDEGFYAHRCDM
jgi:hypothetical protein